MHCPVTADLNRYLDQMDRESARENLADEIRTEVEGEIDCGDLTADALTTDFAGSNFPYLLNQLRLNRTKPEALQELLREIDTCVSKFIDAEVDRRMSGVEA